MLPAFLCLSRCTYAGKIRYSFKSNRIHKSGTSAQACSLPVFLPRTRFAISMSVEVHAHATLASYVLRLGTQQRPWATFRIICDAVVPEFALLPASAKLAPEHVHAPNAPMRSEAEALPEACELGPALADVLPWFRLAPRILRPSTPTYTLVDY